ncbi:hypothetical protein CDAR_49891 [Caerostris darwini]|uniref:Uncharacterized protein n=1 Tax=Caerostris darwini TaxID=1538125 RepID=A0AAV4UHS4_9ARAC|nr:hypothetical protein CDAR_49891 [Caerostris darwini]
MHGDYPSDFLVGSFIEKRTSTPLHSSTTASNSFWGLLVIACFAAADLIMMFREKMKELFCVEYQLTAAKRGCLSGDRQSLWHLGNLDLELFCAIGGFATTIVLFPSDSGSVKVKSVIFLARRVVKRALDKDAPQIGLLDCSLPYRRSSLYPNYSIANRVGGLRPQLHLLGFCRDLITRVDSTFGASYCFETKHNGLYNRKGEGKTASLCFFVASKFIKRNQREDVFFLLIAVMS